MSANLIAISYLIASVLFILSLRGRPHPRFARRGNIAGMVGMPIAVLATLAVTPRVGAGLAMLAVGGAVGVIVSRRVQMTEMPELVAAMHSLVGLAAVLIAIAVVHTPAAFGVPDPIPVGNRAELFIGTFVGAMTFSGSVIAFGKLAGLGRLLRIFSSAPVVFRGQHLVNLTLVGVMAWAGIAFCISGAAEHWPPFIAMTAVAFVLGVLAIIPIGGADMPVVI